jgi:hypothetical protein
MTRIAAVVLALLLLSACSDPGVSPAGVPEPTPSPELESSAPAEEEGYDFEAPIPRFAPGLAAELEEVSRELKRRVRIWTDSGMAPGPEARPVLLRAVRQQRIYRRLLDRPRTARRALELLPPRLEAFARNTVLAGFRLRSLVTPLDDPPDWKIYRPAPARELLRYYKKASRRFDIPWQTLASLNFVESRFGRILGPSSAGAMGPMQFMPATWDAYGNGGNINDPHDSIMGAARYLAASGAPERMNDALFAYNRSMDYVRAIRIYAKQMTNHPSAFAAYYHWQVYVLTKAGDLQLSGPGADV